MQRVLSTTHPPPDLLQAIRNNDQQVLGELYTVNFDAVARYVQKNNGSEEDAKDIYQEAFLAAWRNIQLEKLNDLNQQSLSAYIFQIAKFKWIDQLRSRKIRPSISLEEEKLNGIAAEFVNGDQHEYLDLVKSGFKSLGQKCRDLLNRFYYQKQSIREIASVLNLTEPSAKNNKYRCLQELRTLVKEKIQK